MKFKDTAQFIKYFLKNPKLIASSAVISTGLFVGQKKLTAQELSGIRDKSIIPIVKGVGHSVHSTNFIIQNFDKSSMDFLMKSFEYRYGKDVSNKLFSGTYNIGVKVGTNNFMIKNKPISDKLYEQILL